MKSFLWVAAVLVLPLASVAQEALKYDVPAGWISKPPASSMRLAEFLLPKVKGDPEDAELAIFFFRGQGGSVDANLDRWMKQMEQPDGRPSRERAQTGSFVSNGLKVTVLDVSGTYIAELRPGSYGRHNKPNFRMKAAVLETSAGPYFFKLVGPQKTIARWDQSFAAFLKSVRLR